MKYLRLWPCIGLLKPIMLFGGSVYAFFRVPNVVFRSWPETWYEQVLWWPTWAFTRIGFLYFAVFFGCMLTELLRDLRREVRDL